MARKKKRRLGGLFPPGRQNTPGKVSEKDNNGVEENVTETQEPEGEATETVIPAEPVQEPAEEPVPEPVTESVAEAVEEPVAEPVQEPEAEPVSEPVAEPVPEPIAEPVSEPAAEPVAEQPVPEPVAEPAAAPAEPAAVVTETKEIQKTAEIPVITPELAIKTPEIKATETENRTVTEEKTVKPEANDAMPDFLRSANSTIRRDGPYKNYTGNAEVLRHKEREPEKGRNRRNRKKRQKQRRDGIISTETISLLALFVIIGTIFFCAFKHVEMRELSLTALVVISLITIIMGALLGDAPSYVSLILVALIIIAGAITGMFSEVITAVIIFLGIVTAIKGRFE